MADHCGFAPLRGEVGVVAGVRRHPGSGRRAPGCRGHEADRDPGRRGTASRTGRPCRSALRAVRREVITAPSIVAREAASASSIEATKASMIGSVPRRREAQREARVRAPSYRGAHARAVDVDRLRRASGRRSAGHALVDQRDHLGVAPRGGHARAGRALRRGRLCSSVMRMSGEPPMRSVAVRTSATMACGVGRPR